MDYPTYAGWTDNDMIRDHGTDPLRVDFDVDELSFGSTINIHEPQRPHEDESHDGHIHRNQVKVARTDRSGESTYDDGLSDSEQVPVYDTHPNNADAHGAGQSDGDDVTRENDLLNGDGGSDVRDGISGYSTASMFMGGFTGSLFALIGRGRITFIVAAALAATSSAVAQDDFPDSDLLFVPDLQSQLYRPSVDAEATLWTDDSGGRTDSAYTFGRFAANYINHPFVVHYTGSDGSSRTIDLVKDALQVDVVAGLQYDRFRIGVDLPVYLFTRSDLADEGSGLGDVAFDGRIGLIDHNTSGVGLAVGGRVTLPTASIAGPLGTADGKPGWQAQLIVDKPIGRVLLAANIGYRGIPEQQMLNVIWDDQLMWRLGAGWRLSNTLTLSADVAGAQVIRMLSWDDIAPPSRGAGTPIEALGGAKIGLGEALILDLGVGTGIGQGIGAPSFRIIAGIGYRPAKPTRAEGPTVPVIPPTGSDVADNLPLDTSSLSTPVPEVPTVEVPVVEVPVVEVPVVVEEVPQAAPVGDVRVEVADMNGAPIVGARILANGAGIGQTGDDGVFAATTPIGPTTFAAHADGYRHVEESVDVVEDDVIALVLTAEPATAELVGDQIDLRDSVYFATNEADILPASATLLQDVIDILSDHPELTQMRIEGHTDSRGSAAHNLELSTRRAASVRQYLIDHGIDESRLVSEGFGETKPLDDRQVAEAWTTNRRVDFFVVQRSD